MRKTSVFTKCVIEIELEIKLNISLRLRLTFNDSPLSSGRPSIHYFQTILFVLGQPVNILFRSQGQFHNEIC